MQKLNINGQNQKHKKSKQSGSLRLILTFYSSWRTKTYRHRTTKKKPRKKKIVIMYDREAAKSAWEELDEDE